MYRNKCVAIILLMCIFVFVGCSKEMSFNINNNNQTTDNPQVKSGDIGTHINFFSHIRRTFRKLLMEDSIFLRVLS